MIRHYDPDDAMRDALASFRDSSQSKLALNLLYQHFHPIGGADDSLNFSSNNGEVDAPTFAKIKMLEATLNLEVMPRGTGMALKGNDSAREIFNFLVSIASLDDVKGAEKKFDIAITPGTQIVNAALFWIEDLRRCLKSYYKGEIRAEVIPSDPPGGHGLLRLDMAGILDYDRFTEDRAIMQKTIYPNGRRISHG